MSASSQSAAKRMESHSDGRLLVKKFVLCGAAATVAETGQCCLVKLLSLLQVHLACGIFLSKVSHVSAKSNCLYILLEENTLYFGLVAINETDKLKLTCDQYVVD